MGWGWSCGHWDGVRELCHWESKNGIPALYADLWVRSCGMSPEQEARLEFMEDEDTAQIDAFP